MATRSRLIGKEAMEAKLRRLADRYPDRIRVVLRAHAELIMTTSKRDFVPVDLGNLRASGHVREPTRGTGRLISIELVYGGPAVFYAIRQHEDQELQHTVGSFHYLKKPMDAKVPTLAREMARDLQLSTVPI